MHDAQPAQNFISQRPNGGFNERLFVSSDPGRDDEVLKRAAFQVVHHHVDGFCFRGKN
jgi:hypothetical protein